MSFRRSTRCADTPRRSSKPPDRAAALTNQLLAFSRRQMIQPRVISVNGVMNNIEKMLRRLIGEDIELAMVLSPGRGNIKADPAHMEQAIVNLAINARDAMPAGGRITIETANVRLDEHYAAPIWASSPASS